MPTNKDDSAKQASFQSATFMCSVYLRLVTLIFEYYRVLRLTDMTMKFVVIREGSQKWVVY